MFKIVGNYQGNTQDEIIDEGFKTSGHARRIMWEYMVAFGPNWGPMWVEDPQGVAVEEGLVLQSKYNGDWYASPRRWA